MIALAMFVMILVIANKGYDDSRTNIFLAIGVFTIMLRAVVETGGYELIFILISVYYAQYLARPNNMQIGEKVLNEN